MKKTLFLTFCILYSTLGFAAFGVTTISEEMALTPIKEEASPLNNSSHKILLWNVYKQSKRSFKKELETLLTNEKPQVSLLQEVALKDDDIKSLPCLPKSDCLLSKAFKTKNNSYGREMHGMCKRTS